GTAYTKSPCQPWAAADGAMLCVGEALTTVPAVLCCELPEASEAMVAPPAMARAAVVSVTSFFTMGSPTRDVGQPRGLPGATCQGPVARPAAARLLPQVRGGRS